MDAKLIPYLKTLINSINWHNPDLQCDGFCRCMNYLLRQAGIEHEIWLGVVKPLVQSENVKQHVVHYWIEIDDYIIDAKTKMWLGEDATQGVFKKDTSNLEYIKHGKIATWNTTLQEYKILTNTI